MMGPVQKSVWAAVRQVVTGTVFLLAIVVAEYAVMPWLIQGWEEEAYLLLKQDTLLHTALAVLAAIAGGALLHYMKFGPRDMRPESPADEILWWSKLERLLHWVFVTMVILLVVSGVQLFLAGGGLPDAITRLMRSLHFNELFVLFGLLLFVLWFPEALPRRYDARWLLHSGGYLGFKGHLKAGKFNAGQKTWFWLYMFCGTAMVLTGHQLQNTYSRLDPPYYPILVVHLAAATVFLASMVLHIYLSVIVVRGAMAGMVRGRIGRHAAERHHSEASPLKTGRTCSRNVLSS